MKKLMFFSALLIALNAYATPPPPPVPPPIGFVTARISIRLSINDLTKCDGLMCDQVNKTCDFTAKIPVIAAAKNDEGHWANQILSEDNKRVDCDSSVARMAHRASLGAYASIDESQKLLKIVSDLRFNKSSGNDITELGLSSNTRNVTVVSQLSPLISIKSVNTDRIYQLDESSRVTRTILAKTDHTVEVTVSLDDLSVKHIK